MAWEVVTLVARLEEAPVGAPMFDLGAWLTERRVLIDGNEAAWLDVLAEFDKDKAWELDGQLSCADWLMWRTKMARSTAFEKLRIAHELRRRPIVAAAFAAGEISYSAVRAITRLEGVSAQVDEALVAVARDSSVWALEQAVRYYRLHDEQDKPLDLSNTRYDERGLHIRRGFDGMGSAEVRLNAVELEELRLTIKAYLDRSLAVDESSRVDSGGLTDATTWAQRRVDAFMDIMVRHEAPLNRVG